MTQLAKVNSTKSIDCLGWKAKFETNCKILAFISVNGSMILIAGGYGSNWLASVEIISEDARNNIQLPNLPKSIYGSPSMVKHNRIDPL